MSQSAAAGAQHSARAAISEYSSSLLLNWKQFFDQE